MTLPVSCAIQPGMMLSLCMVLFDRADHEGGNSGEAKDEDQKWPFGFVNVQNSNTCVDPRCLLFSWQLTSYSLMKNVRKLQNEQLDRKIGFMPLFDAYEKILFL